VKHEVEEWCFEDYLISRSVHFIINPHYIESTATKRFQTKNEKFGELDICKNLIKKR